MNKLIFATNNPHKLREIRQILKDKFEVDSLQDIGFQEEIAETSHTLEGNAILKARIIQQRYRRDCFADDTGLEIHALGGKPGVHSARYAGEDCIAENNIQKVLSELNGATDRKARFRAVIALILDGKEYLFEGIVNGTIIDTKRGKDGFGYDPIFVPDGKELTFAEMSPEEKNKISHRGRALKKLTEFLSEI